MEQKRILIADDEEDVVYCLKNFLARKGYAAEGATSGEEALRKLSEKNADLILLDIQLPDIDGLEVAKRIRASEVESKIPIVAVTSYAMPGDKEKIMEAGCNGYLAKPINVEEFIREVDKHL